jgi:hypothetical protein
MLKDGLALVNGTLEMALLGIVGLGASDVVGIGFGMLSSVGDDVIFIWFELVELGCELLTFVGNGCNSFSICSLERLSFADTSISPSLGWIHSFKILL